MLRPSHVAAEPTADSSKIPPILGVLIKSVLAYDKKWKHYAMFNSTEYEVVAAKDQPFPEALLPSAHPGRIVSIRSDLVTPRSPILATNLHVPELADIQKWNNVKVLLQLLPDGFGKIHYEPTGMHVKVIRHPLTNPALMTRSPSCAPYSIIKLRAIYKSRFQDLHSEMPKRYPNWSSRFSPKEPMSSSNSPLASLLGKPMPAISAW